MYKEMGRLGCLCLRFISYQEDVISDRYCGYRAGFDVELLPCVKVCNHKWRVSLAFRWLCWELVWFRYKRMKGGKQWKG